MANALDSCIPIRPLPQDVFANLCFLTEAEINRWTNIAFTEAFALWPFIDRPQFDFHVRLLFGRRGNTQVETDRDYLGLVHAVIALGQRHDTDLIDTSGVDSVSGESRG